MRGGFGMPKSDWRVVWQWLWIVAVSAAAKMIGRGRWQDCGPAFALSGMIAAYRADIRLQKKMNLWRSIEELERRKIRRTVESPAMCSAQKCLKIRSEIMIWPMHFIPYHPYTCESMSRMSTSVKTKCSRAFWGMARRKYGDGVW